MAARRTLHFATIHDALADARTLAATERAGSLERCGNWSLGKTFGHLATWANMPFDGYPPEATPPLPIRLILRLVKNRILKNGMPAGVKVGRIPGGTLGLDEMPSEQGLAALEKAFARLNGTNPRIANPAFGPLTHEQWIQLNLRHAELHLSFHVPINQT